MSHWYLDGSRFDERHPMWGKIEGWPKTQKGEPVKRINDTIRVRLGCVEGITSILQRVGDKGGLMNWFMGIGVQAAIGVFYNSESGKGTMAVDAWMETAKQAARELSDAAATRGTAFHEALESDTPAFDPIMEAARQNVLALHESDGISGGIKEWVAQSDWWGGFGCTIDYVHKGRRAIRDYKTSEGGREPRLSDLGQMAACAIAAFGGIDNVDAANIYIDTLTGSAKVVRWNRDAMELGAALVKTACDATKLERAFNAKIKEMK